MLTHKKRTPVIIICCVSAQASHNIGFAFDTDDGLVVPNVKNVQELTVLEVAEEMTRLMDLGFRGKLGADDLLGGTFTVSNIGSVRHDTAARSLTHVICAQSIC